jgi:hypothetical protein
LGIFGYFLQLLVVQKRIMGDDGGRSQNEGGEKTTERISWANCLLFDIFWRFFFANFEKKKKQNKKIKITKLQN